MELDDESRERLDTAALDALFDSIDRRLQPGRTTEESSPAAAVSANPFGQAPDTGSSAQEAEPPIRNTVVRLSDEVFQSPDLQPPPGSGPPPAAPRSFTARATQVNVTDGRKQRDGAGKQFWTFVVRTQLEDGQILLSERRYTDFATLHDELAPCLALPAAFPGMPSEGSPRTCTDRESAAHARGPLVGTVAAVAPLTLQAALGMAPSSARTQQLGEYLSRVLATVRDGPSTPPALRTFLRPPPFAAVASPAADCLAALPVLRPADSNLRWADRPLSAFGQHRGRAVSLTRWGLASRRRALPSRRWWPSCAGTPPTSACSAPAARGCAS